MTEILRRGAFVFIALSFLMTLTASIPVGANPPGNNGTIKVGAPNDTEDIDNGNQPKISGCVVRVEWFGFDSGQRTSTVEFKAKAPTKDQLVSPIGPQNHTFTGQGQGGVRDDYKDYTLAFSGSPQADGYKVKVIVETDGSQGNDKKSKVFWIEGCNNEEKPPKKVKPILECVDFIGNSRYIAYFGYNNKNDEKVKINRGDDNSVTGGGLTGQKQGQPKKFLPGIHEEVFNVEFDGTKLTWKINYEGKVAKASATSESTPCMIPEQPEYEFQFEKEWEGDEVDLEGVEVTFYIGDTEWQLGDDPVTEGIKPGVVLEPLDEKVTGLPENCTYESDLPESYTVPNDEMINGFRLLDDDMEDDSTLYTLEVTNTVECEDDPVTPVTPEGETETPVTPASSTATTQQVTATPVGAVDAGAGSALTALVGLFGSTGLVSLGAFLRRFSL